MPRKAELHRVKLQASFSARDSFPRLGRRRLARAGPASGTPPDHKATNATRVITNCCAKTCLLLLVAGQQELVDGLVTRGIPLRARGEISSGMEVFVTISNIRRTNSKQLKPGLDITAPAIARLFSKNKNPSHLPAKRTALASAAEAW